MIPFTPMYSTDIEIRTEFEAYHFWPEAPEEVMFLRGIHRHIFKVRARMNVSHSDRELEFFIVKGKINGMIHKVILKDGNFLGRTSCEDIAKMIVDWIVLNLGRIKIEVEVSEDGENGAIVRFE